MLSDKAFSIARQGLPRPTTVTEVQAETASPAVMAVQSCARSSCSAGGLILVQTAAGWSIVLHDDAAWLGPNYTEKPKRPDGTACENASDPGCVTGTPERLGGIKVSPALYGLLTTARPTPDGDPGTTKLGQLHSFFEDQLAVPIVPALHLPLPEDARLRRLCAALLANPANSELAASWATRIGVNASTLDRCFRRETSLTFVEWRQRARLFRAVVLLAGGARVGIAAWACGYASPSAFTVAFRRHLGIMPRHVRPRRMSRAARFNRTAPTASSAAG